MIVSTEDIVRRLRAHKGDGTNLSRTAANAIERLQEAKRAALKVADERSKENVALRAEVERLRERLKQRINFDRFVHLWVSRDNVTDAERISVIKHHPSLEYLNADFEVV